MKNIDKQLKLYEIILNDDSSLGFLGMSVDRTRSLISRNISLTTGISLIKDTIPNLNYSDLTEDFILATEISGSESEILFKENDDEFIYKLNHPSLKINDNKLNSYIWNIILQSWIFPECKYYDFKYVESIHGDPMIFMKQRMLDSRPPSQFLINKLMKDNGFEFSQKFNCYVSLLNLGDCEILLLIEDLNPSNARIINGKLYAFDPRFKLI